MSKLKHKTHSFSLISRCFLSVLAGICLTATCLADGHHKKQHGPNFPASVQTQIQQIIQAQGDVKDGVLSIEVDRNDITGETIHSVPILPSFEINGTLYFQMLNGKGGDGDGDGDGDDNGSKGNNVMLNGDIALLSSEVDPFIDALVANGLTFQAEHQHFYDLTPPVWFIHYRMKGSATKVASAVKAALSVTATPFPQTMPSNPTTPLPAQTLAQILGGTATVGEDGVVTVDVERDDPIWLGGVQILPDLGVQTTIEFEPYGGGQNAAVAPDFGMTADEVQQVIKTMRAQGWDIGCLYNQETDEKPQLYFSHNFKTGDAVQLAKEIRKGLNHMDMRFKS